MNQKNMKILSEPNTVYLAQTKSLCSYDSFSLIKYSSVYLVQTESSCSFDSFSLIKYSSVYLVHRGIFN
jgi:hypothetical protein